MSPPQTFSDVDALVDTLIATLGSHIRLALPLGIGKANRLASALYERASHDPSLQLDIYTALTLEPPAPDNELAKRFLEPIQDAFFGGYPRLEYARALKERCLPENITVTEFFLQPGNWLDTEQVQQAYCSINYTHALDFLRRAKINLVGQLVTPENDEYPGQVSFSCNPDITPDLIKERRAGNANFILVGEINSQLPFMLGEALCEQQHFDFTLNNSQTHFPLFKPPHQPVSLADHAIALHTACLVKDGGTLQIGIGSISDAIASALIMRHRQNREFIELTNALGVITDAERQPFSEGLYGLSEMLVEGFLALLEEQILTRECDGVSLHAGFFMGSPSFYRTLEKLTPEQHRKIAMMPVSFINQLYGQEAQKRAERASARFINSAMMVTLTGAVVSDALENGQVISGVGGQYNFVEQAHALGDSARSVITLRATRTHRGKTDSNIRWSYGHTTIPRHLRDIVVTEYGVAELRGKSDAEVIAALLNIADSRFQAELLERAKRAGKLPASHTIAPEHCRNTPEQLAKRLQPALDSGLLERFPLGCDFTPTEQRLTVALEHLSQNAGSVKSLLMALYRGIATRDSAYSDELNRMALQELQSPRQWLYKTLLKGALTDTVRGKVSRD